MRRACFDDSGSSKAWWLLKAGSAQARILHGGYADRIPQGDGQLCHWGPVITVDCEGEVHGMTANAFASVSLDPLLVLVCVDQQARTHAHLHAKKRFGVNVLAESQTAVSQYYADPNPTHRPAEREAGARFDRTQHGTPVLHGALAYLECRLHTVQDAGDHTIFIAEVEDVMVRQGDPLLYFRGEYRKIGAKD